MNNKNFLFRNVQKKIQGMEGQYDVCTEDLFNQSIRLEELEKKLR